MGRRINHGQARLHCSILVNMEQVPISVAARRVIIAARRDGG
jgi:hypothetical protein